MSEENIEIVRRGYDAFDRRDLETLGEIITDDFELDISSHPIPDFPNTGWAEITCSGSSPRTEAVSPSTR